MVIENESVKKPRKPRQPRKPKVKDNNQDEPIVNNIDSNIMETIHNQPIPDIPDIPLTLKEPIKEPIKETKIRKKATSKSKQVNTIDSILSSSVSNELVNDDNVLADNIPNNSVIVNNNSIVNVNIEYEYSGEILHMYHISDIHIQLYKRHDEYRIVFQRVYDYLNKEKQDAGIPLNKNRNIPMIVVITGDILHSKADLSPECIQLTYTFIKTLSSIMPVVLIAGNHDININNRDRLDSLTPILADLPLVNPVYYILETGVYKLGNIVFYHSSFLDNKIEFIKPNRNMNMNMNRNEGKNVGKTVGNTGNVSNLVHVCLYHGRVNGAVYFNGMECNETGSNGNKTITPSVFEEYDLSLLGDIHKHQFLTPNIAYAGSLIQQNIGEDIHEHGLIKWSVATKTGNHVSIKNDWSYVNIYVNNKKTSYLCSGSNGEHSTTCTLSKNISIRILYKNTPESYLSDYITLMKMNHNVVDFRWNNDENIITELGLGNNGIVNDVDGVNGVNGVDGVNGVNGMMVGSDGSMNGNVGVVMKKSALIDITLPEVQNSYLEDIIRNGNEDITDDEIIAIKNMNMEQNRILKENNKQFSNYAFNGHYKIKRLEFSNLFSFGEKNVIDFTNFKGIVGIIAPNHLGKSSIIDIIVYTLFDEFTRKGSTKDIININKDSFHIKMELIVAKWVYTIIKTGYRTRVGASVKIEFYRTHQETGIRESLEEDNIAKTKDKIMEYFGCYEDIIHTSFSIQHDNACFIDSTNTKRKDELERIMRFEIVKKLYEQINQRYNKDKAIYDHIRKKFNNDDVARTKKEKQKANKLLSIIQADREYAKARIKEINQSILTESKKLHNDCNTFIEENNEHETEEILGNLNQQLANLNKSSQIIYNTIEHNTTKEDVKEEDIKEEDVKGEDVKEEDIKEEEVNARMKLSNIKGKLIADEQSLVANIKETNKKIKSVSQILEKLYKSRKPLHTKLPKGVSSSNDIIIHLEVEKEKINTQITVIEQNTLKINEKIIKLRHNEEVIESNNEKILLLEKQMIKLPECMQLFLAECPELSVLQAEYREQTECLFDMIISNPNMQLDNIFDNILESVEYVEYEKKAKKYFLYQELQNYDKQGENEIEEQNELESLNQILKKEMREISILEGQVRTNTNKIIQMHNGIKTIDADIECVKMNESIENEILDIKKRQDKYDIRLLEQEQMLEDVKKKMKQITEWERLEIKIRSCQLEIQSTYHILEQFNKYRNQIEENKPILETITQYKNELTDFEHVLELIEKKYQIEQVVFNKASTLLEQMKKEILEGREIETRLRLQEIYRDALKELPYILLSKIQPLLEKKVNDLLSITTDFSVRFDMSDSKIDIYLDRAIYTDKSRNIIINNASGFERFMASLAIRMALLDLSNLPKINFLAIDEGWSSFDTHNINNVSIILDYLTTKFDFVLTISHLIQIKEHCDIQISLRRDEKGFSRIIY